jgi:hypothetical protein
VQACTKNTCVNDVEKPVDGDGPDRMQRLGIKSHVRGRWRKRRESAPRDGDGDGDGDGAEERVWLEVWGERGAARRPAAKKREGRGHPMGHASPCHPMPLFILFSIGYHMLS